MPYNKRLTKQERRQVVSHRRSVRLYESLERRSYLEKYLEAEDNSQKLSTDLSTGSRSTKNLKNYLYKK